MAGGGSSTSCSASTRSCSPRSLFGARGAVGSSYNFAAPIYRKVIAAFEAGGLDRGPPGTARAVALIRLLVRYDYLPAAKFVMARSSASPSGRPASPLPDLGPEARTGLERELHETGLWDVATDPLNQGLDRQGTGAFPGRRRVGRDPDGRGPGRQGSRTPVRGLAPA